MGNKQMRSEKITVYIDDKPKRIFLGLQVKHAIGPRRTKAVLGHRAIVEDADGNRVGVEGALYDGERLYVRPSDPESFAQDVLRRSR